MVGYFFVGGAPKSGTTWMQRSLDLHPQIVCSGEGHLHECIVRPVAEMIQAYNAKLRGVAELVYEGAPYCLPLSRDEQIELTRMVMAALMQRRGKPGARMIGDKTPANAKIVDDLAVLFPGMKFVAMVRDPRDVAASRIGHARRTGHAEADDRASDFYRELVSASARDWRSSVERSLQFAMRAPGQAVVVRYEDLVRAPAEGLARVFDFLGVETSTAELERIVRASSFEALSGGRKAGVESPGSFYRKGVAGDWPNHLNEEALEILARECGPAIDQAGYRIDRSQPAA